MNNREILELARFALFTKIDKEEKFYKEFFKEHNRESVISLHRILKYQEQLDEISAELSKAE